MCVKMNFIYAFTVLLALQTFNPAGARSTGVIAEGPDNAVDTYIIQEDTANHTLKIVNPRAEKPVLREIIYYHLIEKPYSGQDVEETNEGSGETTTFIPEPADDTTRSFTNAHGFQFNHEVDHTESLPTSIPTEESRGIDLAEGSTPEYYNEGFSDVFQPQVIADESTVLPVFGSDNDDVSQPQFGADVFGSPVTGTPEQFSTTGVSMMEPSDLLQEKDDDVSAFIPSVSQLRSKRSLREREQEESLPYPDVVSSEAPDFSDLPSLPTINGDNWRDNAGGMGEPNVPELPNLPEFSQGSVPENIPYLPSMGNPDFRDVPPLPMLPSGDEDLAPVSDEDDASLNSTNIPPASPIMPTFTEEMTPEDVATVGSTEIPDAPTLEPLNFDRLPNYFRTLYPVDDGSDTSDEPSLRSLGDDTTTDIVEDIALTETPDTLETTDSQTLDEDATEPSEDLTTIDTSVIPDAPTLAPLDFDSLPKYIRTAYSEEGSGLSASTDYPLLDSELSSVDDQTEIETSDSTTLKYGDLPEDVDDNASTESNLNNEDTTTYQPSSIEDKESLYRGDIQGIQREGTDDTFTTRRGLNQDGDEIQNGGIVQNGDQIQDGRLGGVKTWGMDLRSDRGIVWNGMSSSRGHAEVGSAETVDNEQETFYTTALSDERPANEDYITSTASYDLGLNQEDTTATLDMEGRRVDILGNGKEAMDEVFTTLRDQYQNGGGIQNGDDVQNGDNLQNGRPGIEDVKTWGMDLSNGRGKVWNEMGSSGILREVGDAETVVDDEQNLGSTTMTSDLGNLGGSGEETTVAGDVDSGVLLRSDTGTADELPVGSEEEIGAAKEDTTAGTEDKVGEAQEEAIGTEGETELANGGSLVGADGKVVGVSERTWGMNLTENGGEVWNNLNKPGFSFNVGGENSEGTSTSGDNGDSSNVEGNQETALVEDNAGTALVEDNAGTALVEDNAGPAPVEDNAGTAPVEDNGGTALVEDNAGTALVEDNAGTAPVEDNAGTPIVTDTAVMDGSTESDAGSSDSSRPGVTPDTAVVSSEGNDGLTTEANGGFVINTDTNSQHTHGSDDISVEVEDKDRESNGGSQDKVGGSEVLRGVPASVEELMKKEEFWTWLQSWTSSYMELFTARLREDIKLEVSKQLDEKLSQMYDKEDSEDGGILIEYCTDEGCSSGDDGDDNSEAPASPERPVDVELPSTQTVNSEEVSEAKESQRIEVQSQVIYGNALGNKNVTNVFIFFDKASDDVIESLKPLINGMLITNTTSTIEAENAANITLTTNILGERANVKNLDNVGSTEPAMAGRRLLIPSGHKYRKVIRRIKVSKNGTVVSDDKVPKVGAGGVDSVTDIVGVTGTAFGTDKSDVTESVTMTDSDVEVTDNAFVTDKSDVTESVTTPDSNVDEGGNAFKTDKSDVTESVTTTDSNVYVTDYAFATDKTDDMISMTENMGVTESVFVTDKAYPTEFVSTTDRKENLDVTKAADYVTDRIDVEKADVTKGLVLDVSTGKELLTPTSESFYIKPQRI